MNYSFCDRVFIIIVVSMSDLKDKVVVVVVRLLFRKSVLLLTTQEKEEGKKKDIFTEYIKNIKTLVQ